jgi:ectoine hydroxylase-related dioxygenase (phytanoyl-CoA dioxygenase family)
MLGQAVPAEVPEGGVVLHHGDVLHGAGPNTTDLPRAAILTCYFPDGSRRRGTLAQWMADRHHVRPGDRLVGPGLPLIGEA